MKERGICSKMRVDNQEILKEVLSEETRNEFVQAVLKHEIIEFKKLYNDILQISETNGRHHLRILSEKKIIQRIKKKGTKSIFLSITSSYFEPLRDYYQINTQKIYMGMVGERNPGRQIHKAIDSLQMKEWYFELIHIFTTEENSLILQESPEWSELANFGTQTNISTIPLYDFEDAYSTMKSNIDQYIRKYSILTDITGGTKIQTVSLYSLAQEYGLKRIYIPENERRTIITLP